MVEVVEHPAKFSDVILDEVVSGLIRHGVTPPADILDPFAGVGGVHRLRDFGWSTYGVELEPEWANQSPYTVVGDATRLDDAGLALDMFPPAAIVTSPCYGNRMADHHNARDGSKRHTYRHTIGRELSPNSAGAMQWGDTYRELHEKAWAEAAWVLEPNGLFVLNVSNHIRRGKVQKVTEWHLRTLVDVGFTLVEVVPVATKRQRHGKNGSARVAFETVAYLRRD